MDAAMLPMISTEAIVIEAHPVICSRQVCAWINQSPAPIVINFKPSQKIPSKIGNRLTPRPPSAMQNWMVKHALMDPPKIASARIKGLNCGDKKKGVLVNSRIMVPVLSGVMALGAAESLNSPMCCPGIAWTRRVSVFLFGLIDGYATFMLSLGIALPVSSAKIERNIAFPASPWGFAP